MHGAIEDDKGWQDATWEAGGRFRTGYTRSEDPSDLIPVPPKPKKYTRWFVVGPTLGYATREQAVRMAKFIDGVTVKSLEYTEGEGLA